MAFRFMSMSFISASPVVGSTESLSEWSPEYMCAVNMAMAMTGTRELQTHEENSKAFSYAVRLRGQWYVVCVKMVIVFAEMVCCGFLLLDVYSMKTVPLQRLSLLWLVKPAPLIQMDTITLTPVYLYAVTLPPRLSMCYMSPPLFSTLYKYPQLPKCCGFSSQEPRPCSQLVCVCVCICVFFIPLLPIQVQGPRSHAWTLHLGIWIVSS